jgi:Xaa-Pro aminopeptidase
VTPPGSDAVSLDAPFVHVGRPDVDPDVRYLSGVAVPVRCAVVVADGTRLFVPAAVADDVDAPADVAVTAVDASVPVGRAAADALARDDGGGRVVAPRTVPHDAALYVESAGFELESTTAVAQARAAKTDPEADAVAAAARAANEGVERAAATLAAATGDELRVDGERLTARRLRRGVAATVVAADATPHVEVSTATREPDEPLERGDLAAVSVLARGPTGYHARVDRTLSVDGDGGWERRAQLAAESALRAGRAAATPDAAAADVGSELRAELAAYGFDDERESDAGAGVGLAPRERPRLDGDGSLPSGATVALAAGVRGEAGRVRLAETVRVTADGAERLAPLTTSLSPAAY